MKFIETLSALRDIRQQWRNTQQRVAFVPTMGNLHDGHIELVKKARTLADVVVVSIFSRKVITSPFSDIKHTPVRWTWGYLLPARPEVQVTTG